MTLLGPDKPRFPIGIADYAELRREGYSYVDKTRFVAGVIDTSAKALLFPRPRRFGKTLNMSTLRHFLERSDEDRTKLFEDTWIWSADDGRYREYFQRYPVIQLTFKDVKASTWDEAWADLRALLIEELRRLDRVGHIDLESSGDIAERQRLLDSDGPPGNFRAMLRVVTRWCTQATGERVVILIDEYDAPLHAAWQHGYWDDAIGFFRTFLSAGYKDQKDLFRGVLTGILKVAKENIFSGLNNVDTYSLLQPAMSTEFGFLEGEVEEAARAAGRQSDLPALREWYDGYSFGGTRPSRMFNPWSVLQYLSKPEAGTQSFWKNTSSNDLVRDLLIRRAAMVGQDVQRLIAGETIDKTIDENVALQELEWQPAAVWSLLTFSGYLTAETAAPTRRGFSVKLRIPNEEVRAVFEDVFAGLLDRSAQGGSVEALVDAMLSGDTVAFEQELGHVLKAATSYFDFGVQPVEAVYQAFVVGLLVHLDATHRVRSNREAGYGRADVLVTPRSPGPGAVLELKTVNEDYDETRESALESAVAQLRDRDYAAEVREGGATEVHQYGIVFDGKRCWIRMVE